MIRFVLKDWKILLQGAGMILSLESSVAKEYREKFRG